MSCKDVLNGIKLGEVFSSWKGLVFCSLALGLLEAIYLFSYMEAYALGGQGVVQKQIGNSKLQLFS